MADNTSKSETQPTTTTKGIGRRLRTAGWGLFLIWVGASILMGLSWGVGLIGVAAVIFLMQVAGRYYGRKLERFWVVVAVLFLLGGVWELFHIQLELGPILLIAAGGALLLTLFRRRWGADGRHPSSHWCGWRRPTRSRST
jgi:hypothetical protein